LDFSDLAEKEIIWSTPSIGRSCGTEPPANLRESRESIDLMHDLVADTTCQNSGWATRMMNWCSQRAFHVREVVARHPPKIPCQGQVASGPLSLVNTTMVLSRMLSESIRVEVSRRHVRVHFGKRIRKITDSRSCRQTSDSASVRAMDQREGNVSIEGLVCLHAAFHEIDRAACDLSID
jgi:hypothetical protein